MKNKRLMVYLGSLLALAACDVFNGIVFHAKGATGFELVVAAFISAWIMEGEA